MSDAASKKQKKTRGRPFEPGGPGGPGRPQGSRNKATLALDKIAGRRGGDDPAQDGEAAKGGDMRAADWCCRGSGRPGRAARSLWLCRRSRRLPTSCSPLAPVADAVAAGDVTPDEGSAGRERAGNQAPLDRDRGPRTAD